MSFNAGVAHVDVKARMDQFQRDVQTGVRGTMSRVGSSAVALGRGLTRSVTLPLVGLGTVASRTFMGFEESLSRVVGLVGVSREEVDRMGEAILELAPKVGKGPGELAEALFFVTSAGFRGSEAMDVLETSAKASAAGLGDTTTIADTLTSAINAYGQENLDAGRAADILTAAVREGKLEASALGPVLGRLLPTASAMGIGFEQVAGVLAVMSRTGANAAEGATSLNSIMSAMLKPTTQAQKALEGVELKFSDLTAMAAKPGGLLEVMKTLEERFEGNDEGLAQVIPNVRAFRGVMNVLAQDADSVSDVLDGVENSVGSLDRAFGEAEETSRLKFAQFKARLEGTFIRLGNVILPVIIPIFQKIVDFIERMVEAWDGLSPGMKQFSVILGLIAAAAGPVLLIIGKILTVLAAISAPVLVAIAVFAGLVAGVMALVRWFRSGDERAEALKAKLIEFRDEALIPLRDRFLDLWERVKEAWPDIREKIVGALEAVSGMLDDVLPLLRRLFNLLGDIMAVAGPVAIEVAKFIAVWNLSILRDAAAVIGAIARAIEAVLRGLERMPSWARGLLIGGITGSPGAVVRGFAGGGSSAPSGRTPLRLNVDRRAHGGPVAAGRSYWVGEQGVELFTPSAAGHITPNDRLASSGDMGGDVYLDGDRVGRWVARDLQKRSRSR